jgi:hypothetical protein
MHDLPEPLPLPEPKDKPPLERDIEAAVCRYATARGWYVRKFASPNHRSVPDRVFIAPNGKILWIEFKRPGNKLTEAQAREFEKLKAVKQTVVMIDTVEAGKALVALTDRYS